VTGRPAVPAATDGAGDVLVARTTSGALVATEVRIASSFWARFRGLMGRPSLPSGEGLWFPRTSSIHMLFMRFAIDCVFLSRPAGDGSREALAVRHALPPWRGIVWTVRGADGVLELPSGTLAAAGVVVGDRLVLEPAD
jgi:uncharacterized protein